MSDWKPLAQVPEFGGVAPEVPAPPVGNVSMAQPPAHTSSQNIPNIPNYLWQSIVATVLCCMPFGVVAIVFAAKVDSLVARGDIAGALAASQSAKNWTIAAVATGGVIIVGYLALIIVGVASGEM